MRLIVPKAFLGLLAFDVLLLGRDFARLHKVISRWRTVGASNPAEAVNSICQAVNRACVWYPKRVLCLQRSFVTTCLLRSSGVPASMVLGAQHLPFKAHAWVEVDGRPVNERSNVQEIFGVWERC